MMAINNANRLLFWGLLAALSAPACRAQGTPVPIGEAIQEASQDSAGTPSAALAEMPPKVPKVTCSGDQLTISADNSTLGSVLAAVHTCVGVQVDIPEGAAGSRVFEELGPGPARQVLESLLSGTDFNFVIGSSDTDPQKIESVLLMLRPTETASVHDSANDRSPSAARRAWLQSRQNRSASLSPDENHATPEEAPSVPETEDTAAAPVENAPAANPAQVPAAQVPATDQPSAAAEALSSPGDKTAAPASTSEPPAPSPTAGSTPAQGTEQMISDMQQLFQQRRQMNQNQNQNQNQSPVSPQP
jgi:hypothetical protein